METLKFLMVSTHYPPAHLGGDAKLVQYLSTELVRRGHEVHVFHNPAAYALVRGEFRTRRDPQMEVHVHPHRSSMARIDPILSLVLDRGTGSRAELGRLVSELRPDVVHWHNTKGFIGAPIPTRASAVLYTAHDFYTICPRSSLLRPSLRPCDQPLLCQTCLLAWRKPPQLWRIRHRIIALPPGLRVISPSEFHASRLAKEGIRVHHVLRNFVPRPRTMPATGSDATGLVFLGAVEKWKGVLTLLEAMHLSKEAHGFDLSIYGTGSAEGLVRKRIEDLGLTGRVRLHGFVPVEEITETLRNAAAMVFPAEAYENAPLAVLEALSLGVPVIGSHIGGLPEILVPEAGCATFPPGDAKRLAQEIIRLWENRSQLPRLRQLARTAYETSFSPETHLREYMNIVRQCTASST